MSATIYYQAVKGKSLHIGGPSGFLELLRRVFGEGRPWTFTDCDAAKLETAANATDQTEYRDALLELSEAVCKHGEIRVWPEY